MPLILKIFEIKILIFLHGFNTVCYLKEYKHSLSTLGIYRMTLNCSWIFVWIRAGSVAHKNVWILLCLIGGFFLGAFSTSAPTRHLKKSNSLAAVWRKLSHYQKLLFTSIHSVPAVATPSIITTWRKWRPAALHSTAGACNCELTQKIKTLVYLQHLLCNHISTIFQFVYSLVGIPPESAIGILFAVTYSTAQPHKGRAIRHFLFNGSQYWSFSIVVPSMNHYR